MSLLLGLKKFLSSSVFGEDSRYFRKAGHACDLNKKGLLSENLRQFDEKRCKPLSSNEVSNFWSVKMPTNNKRHCVWVPNSISVQNKPRVIFNINVPALKNLFTPLHPKSKHLLKLAQISNARVWSIDIVSNQKLTGVLQKSCFTHGKTPEMASIFSKVETLCMQLYQKFLLPR